MSRFSGRQLARTARMNTRDPLPYWLAEGTERCEICSFSYHLEVEVRCVGCDAGVCEHCAVTVRETLEVFCVPCHDAETG